jgi:hypothetical protein
MSTMSLGAMKGGFDRVYNLLETAASTHSHSYHILAVKKSQTESHHGTGGPCDLDQEAKEHIVQRNWTMLKRKILAIAYQVIQINVTSMRTLLILLLGT